MTECADALREIVEAVEDVNDDSSAEDILALVHRIAKRALSSTPEADHA